MAIVTRRQTLGFGLGFVLAKPSFLYAQSQSDFDKIGPYVRNAIDVLSLAIDADRSEDNALDHVARDYHSRRRLIAKAHETGLLRDRDNAAQFVKAIPILGPQYFPAEYFNANTFKSQFMTIDAAVKWGLPIVPDVKSVQPIGVPSVEPPKLPKSAQSDLLVVTAIIFETLSIGVSEGAISAFIKDNPDFEKDVNQALKHAINAEWSKLSKVSEKLYPIIVGSTLFGTLITTEAAKKIIFNLAIRCAPIVGWVYFAASFVIAIKRNYHRFSFT